jgi:hypothetical protein
MSRVPSEIGGRNQPQYVAERYEEKDNNTCFSHGLIVILWRHQVKREVAPFQPEPVPSTRFTSV